MKAAAGKLTVSGLKGGHSGSNIDKELGNANKIAVRCLRELVKNELEVWIADWDGGNKGQRDSARLLDSVRQPGFAQGSEVRRAGSGTGKGGAEGQ